MTLISLEALKGAEFHDAILVDMIFFAKEASCVVRLEIYENEASPDRVPVTLSFDGVTACMARLDFTSLLDNAWAGNVQNCRVDIDRGVVRLYLVDGLIEISARSTRMTRG